MEIRISITSNTIYAMEQYRRDNTDTAKLGPSIDKSLIVPILAIKPDRLVIIPEGITAFLAMLILPILLLLPHNNTAATQ